MYEKLNVCCAVHAVQKQYNNHKRTFKMFRKQHTQSVNKRLMQREREKERESEMPYGWS